MRLIGDFLRGHTQTVILSILNNDDSYGYKLGKTIIDASKGIFNVTEATLYNALKRLEKDELINHYYKDGDNGKKRKYYSITKKGRLYLHERRDEWILVKEFLDNLIRGTYERKN